MHLQYHHHNNNNDDPLLLQQPQNKDNTIAKQQEQPQSNSNQNEQQQQDMTDAGKEFIPWSSSSSSSPWTPEIVALIFDNLPCTLPRGMTTQPPPNGVEELIGLALRHGIPIPSIFKNSQQQQWELNLSKIAMILYQLHHMEDALTYSNPYVIVETIATTLWSSCSSSKQLSLLSPAQQCAKALLENDGGMACLLYIMDKEFCQVVLNNEGKKQKNCTKATTAWLAQIPVLVRNVSSQRR